MPKEINLRVANTRRREMKEGGHILTKDEQKAILFDPTT